MSVPGWVQDAVFYQIFPDRFANGDPGNDPPNVQAWGAPPTLHGVQGGDLPGVIQHFDYLLDLGINALYLNPIFQATSTHRYNTTDYYRIDPRLGDEADLRALLDLAHRHGVRVILDGVFNHCGRGFFAFNDLLENEAHSPYRDWFHVRRFPLDAYGPGQADNYLAWWKFKSLPKFNTNNPEVRRFLLGVARHWIEQGIDGWRLDVPNEIDDDSFWAEFRDQVRQANPEAYLVGEIWDADPRWVGPGHFDGLINYPLRKSLLALIAEGALKPSEFARQVERLFQVFPIEHMHAHYLTLGSHDTERVRTLCGGDLRKVRLMSLFLFCFPGAPGIY
jgi:cyclomaltodextrinase